MERWIAGVMKEMRRFLKLAVGTWLLASGFGAVPGHAQADLLDQFTFVRLRYSMGRAGLAFRMRYGGYDSWMVDSPTAEENFLTVLRQMTALPNSGRSIYLSMIDPELFNYPFAYMVEVGYLELSAEEAASLRQWLLRGGFLMIDDFHGPLEWHHFIVQFRKVFPDRPIRDIPPEHPIFHCYYDFDYFPQVPGLAALYRGVTYEKGGKVPHCRGIFDDDDRLMVLINHNVDLGDSWEHSKDPRYDVKYSLMGYKLGINYIIYALTH